ncbi:sortase [Candidatus Shapirobacteria bacterium]|nr:sortase [Candidatus Shapirobacteria bacterium]
MTPYIYLKAERRPKVVILRPQIMVFLPAMFMMVGIFLLANAVLPIISYQLFISPRFSRQEFVRPISQEDLLRQPAEVFTPVVLGEEAPFEYIDFAKWFPSASKPEGRPSKITHYTISIPKLGIENAVVEISSLDIKKSLIQYPGTANPGQPGNAIIFGHSTLPFLFNPQNYITIFSTLPNLKAGDEVLANFDGIIYRYRVEEMVETKPEDISVLEQRYDDSYLTLITCVPPGSYLRRLIVRARLSVI